MTEPNYPIYIPSKGRWEACSTANFLRADGVSFRLVVEQEEFDNYASMYGEERCLVLPFSNAGLVAARNWIKEHATEEGHERHWQFDDNISEVMRRWRAFRIRCNAGPALTACEDFVDRYENVAVAGLNYAMFATDRNKMPPFQVNVHVYSSTLILNSTPHRWRGRYNDDTDYCLQVLAGGWCTVLFNAFVVQKKPTMTVSGGNTGIYQGDGRLAMARELERRWPGVVQTRRRFKRPQHVINWRKFDTPLRLRPDVDLSKLPAVDDYGLELEQIKPIKSKTLRNLVKDRIRSP